MDDKTYTHAIYSSGQFFLDDNGDIELPIASALAHRFVMRDGEVIDLYEGIDDDAVRLKDWEDGVAAAEEAGDAPPPDFRTPSET